ncbi:MAG: penicillin acylase family protein [Cyclobacteriaceae bacterium]
MINTPGQSADPLSPFYGNLFQLWARDDYFPAYYSRDKIEEVTQERILMAPGKRKNK